LPSTSSALHPPLSSPDYSAPAASCRRAARAGIALLVLFVGGGLVGFLRSLRQKERPLMKNGGKEMRSACGCCGGGGSWRQVWGGGAVRGGCVGRGSGFVKERACWA
jgi:hypothetical protein